MTHLKTRRASVSNGKEDGGGVGPRRECTSFSPPQIDNIKVAVRIRAPTSEELQCPRYTAIVRKQGAVVDGDNTNEGSRQNNVDVKRPQVVVEGFGPSLQFDHVFEGQAAQTTVFDVVGLPLCRWAMDGYNASLFAYGQTGSGKTFTIQGSGDCQPVRPSSDIENTDSSNGTVGARHGLDHSRSRPPRGGSAKRRLVSQQSSKLKRSGSDDSGDGRGAAKQATRNAIPEAKGKPDEYCISEQGERDTDAVSISTTKIEEGTREELNQYCGVIPRSLEYMFGELSTLRPGSTECHISYIEIYQDQIFDLLAEGECEGNNILVRESPDKGVFLEGVRNVSVSSYEEAVALFFKGASSRRIHSTAVNRTSTRAHSVFTIRLERSIKSSDCTGIAGETPDAPLDLTRTRVVPSRGGTPNFRMRSNSLNKVMGRVRQRSSCFHIVDLAGSERQKISDTVGDRLKEASRINASLSVLGMVINTLARNSERKNSGADPSTGSRCNDDDGLRVAGEADRAFVHYRDSKLTHLLKDAIGGNSKTTMIACLSASKLNFAETISTLRFAQRVKNIRNSAVVNEWSSHYGPSDAPPPTTSCVKGRLVAENRLLKERIGVMTRRVGEEGESVPSMVVTNRYRENRRVQDSPSGRLTARSASTSIPTSSAPNYPSQSTGTPTTGTLLDSTGSPTGTPQPLSSVHRKRAPPARSRAVVKNWSTTTPTSLPLSSSTKVDRSVSSTAHLLGKTMRFTTPVKGRLLHHPSSSPSSPTSSSPSFSPTTSSSRPQSSTSTLVDGRGMVRHPIPHRPAKGLRSSRCTGTLGSTGKRFNGRGQMRGDNNKHTVDCDEVFGGAMRREVSGEGEAEGGRESHGRDGSFERSNETHTHTTTSPIDISSLEQSDSQGVTTSSCEENEVSDVLKHVNDGCGGDDVCASLLTTLASEGDMEGGSYYELGTDGVSLCNDERDHQPSAVTTTMALSLLSLEERKEQTRCWSVVKVLELHDHEEMTTTTTSDVLTQTDPTESEIFFNDIPAPISSSEYFTVDEKDKGREKRSNSEAGGDGSLCRTPSISFPSNGSPSYCKSPSFLLNAGGVETQMRDLLIAKEKEIKQLQDKIKWLSRALKWSELQHQSKAAV